MTPEFATAPVLCDACDKESDACVWFIPRTIPHAVLLCPDCCAVLTLKSLRHPKAPSMTPVIHGSLT